jgi:hypothetical protein
VEDHDVARSHDLRQPGRVRRPPALEHGTLVDAQRAAVTGGPVKPVVQPLGHGEEFGVTVDHQPASINARAAGVGQEDSEHLRHATADGGRAHVPDRAAGQGVTRGRGDGMPRPQPVLADDGSEPIHRQGTDMDLLEPGHPSPLRSVRGGRPRSPRGLHAHDCEAISLRRYCPDQVVEVAEIAH